jgi:pimeloyl-ACP methyl ester carboxylesterase
MGGRLRHDSDSMKRALGVVGLIAVNVIGCGRDDSTQASAGGSGGFGAMGGVGGSGGSGNAGGSACMAAASVVQLQTDDGVDLEADHLTTGEVGGPAVVLLHMIPPSNDRKNFPQPFLDALVAKKIQVLNVDRRGAGQSGGTAQDAYVGPNGKLDARAAVAFLAQGDCAADPLRIGIVGASNGTTSALDYGVYSGIQTTELFPSALVFLTGGSYTENQNKLNDNRDFLDPLPILFVFSTLERDWSAGFMPGAPSAWRFEEYDPGDHGTKMFEARPESIDLVVEFLADVL